MYARPTAERVFQIFQEMNNIPRPSHHEERVADYLCQFAERLHLEYQRDAQSDSRWLWLFWRVQISRMVHWR